MRHHPTRFLGPSALALGALLALAPPASRAADLDLPSAIRAAWASHPGLQAGAAQVEAARADRDAADGARLPALTLTARAVATDEPMQAFGLKLDQARITADDFVPDRLNHPDPVGGVGLGAAVSVPLYAGGRIDAGRRGAAAMAEAEVSAQARRRDEVAAAVVEAYLGSQAAAEGVRFAEEQLRQAEETERFVRARSAQGLLLEADVARATAFRAQAQAERAAALQRLQSARSALALLSGEAAAGAQLTTPLELQAPPPAATAAAQAPGAPLARADLAAAHERAVAAHEAAGAARAALLPAVLAQAGVETMRQSFDQGAAWWSAALVVRWNLAFADGDASRAAAARAAAADAATRWQERQARREAEEAARAVETAQARLAAAREAVSASLAARDLRQARHRQGLLPLTDLLDAEAGLAGARALLLRSALDARVARAQLALAQGEPVEGVVP